MNLLLPSIMGLIILILAFTFLVGGGNIRRRTSGVPTGPAQKQPRVSLIIPAAGDNPALADCLSSLLAQNYPHYEIIVVTQSLEDPAWEAARKAAAGRPEIKHVTSGRAFSCGQKNHNLLAGVREAAPDSEIFVFADSTRLAEPQWLSELVRPIILGRAAVTSGYHHVIPQDHRVLTLARAVAVLGLYITRGIPGLNQPWGGGTAVGRTTFEDLKVAQMWSKNVVDDVSLALLLKKAGVAALSVPGACLHTPLEGETPAGLRRWAARQWMYLKLYFPGTWLAGGLFAHLNNLVILTAFFQVLTAASGLGPLYQVFTGGLFLASYTTLGLTMRIFHPSPGPILSWLAAVYAASLMASLSHLTTMFAQKLSWKGITYHLAPDGQVREID
ncbi:MAG: glycosyltransferase family 2 protein [Pseudomonadota bacterium]